MGRGLGWGRSYGTIVCYVLCNRRLGSIRGVDWFHDTTPRLGKGT